MEYLKVNGTEYPAHFCGKQIDRDWDGRASKTVTLAMPYAQAVQLFVDGLRWGIVRREAGADDAAQEQDCSGYCVAGPITDNRDGTLSIKMGSYTQLEQALHLRILLARKHQRQIDIVLQRKGVQQVEILKDKAEMIPAESGHLRLPYRADIPALQQHLPRGGAIQRRQNV